MVQTFHLLEWVQLPLTPIPIVHFNALVRSVVCPCRTVTLVTSLILSLYFAVCWYWNLAETCLHNKLSNKYNVNICFMIYSLEKCHFNVRMFRTLAKNGSSDHVAKKALIIFDHIQFSNKNLDLSVVSFQIFKWSCRVFLSLEYFWFVYYLLYFIFSLYHTIAILLLRLHNSLSGAALLK